MSKTIAKPGESLEETIKRFRKENRLHLRDAKKHRFYDSPGERKRKKISNRPKWR